MNTKVRNIVTGVKTLAVFGLLTGFVLVLAARQPETVTMNFPKSAEPVVNPQVLAAATEGRTCSPEPALTDTIVTLNVKTGVTRIMGFDDTYAAAKAGTVRVVTYCVDAA